jgi:hypothetical protein
MLEASGRLIRPGQARPADAAVAAPRPLSLIEKYRLAHQLLATLSPLVLAETGHLERRGGDRSPADPESLRAGRLREGAARARRRIVARVGAA